MKNLETGELSGPPMPHDEWKKHQDELEKKEREAQASKDKSAKAHEDTRARK